MKISILSALLFAAHVALASSYYVAPGGNDHNPGSKELPFATIQKAQSALRPGDTVYLRGGTYHMTEAQITRQERIYACLFCLDKSGREGKTINYFAYPDERPVFDFSDVKPANLRVAAFYVTGNYIHLKGFEVIGVQVTIKTHTQSECFENHGSHNIYEQLSMHDGMAIGFYLLEGADNLILNCDAYRNWDYVSENGRGGNTDGFGCHPAAGGKNNVFRGCRAWFNSDDGYDCINAHEATVFDHCWAFYNGFNKDFDSEGDGNGFKAGGYARRPGSEVPDPVPRNTVQFCLAVRNKANGFYSNHHINGSTWYNNSAYRNHVNFNMLNRLRDDVMGDVPGYAHKMRNNLGYKGGQEVAMLDPAKCDVANNYFDLPLTAADDDFVSLDETELTAPRHADGSLPDIAFMHLKPNSQFVDKGQDIGFPFMGKAPDLGCFEAGAAHDESNVPGNAAQDNVELHWLNGTPNKMTGVSWGVPWEEGQVKKSTHFVLTRAEGPSVDVQSWPLAYWPDGSIKWTGFAAVVDSGVKTVSLQKITTKEINEAKETKETEAGGPTVQVTEDGQGVGVSTGDMQCLIARSGRSVMPSISLNGKIVATDGQLICLLQDRADADADADVASSPVKQKYTGSVSAVRVEQNGPLRVVVRVEGNFKPVDPKAARGGRSFMPFILRFYFYAGVPTIRLLHTVIFDGDDQKDFIKGLGLTFQVPFREQLQNRHVRFSGEDDGVWAEPVQPLNGRRPIPYAAQQAVGRRMASMDPVPDTKPLFEHMASWNDYRLTQSSADGFTIQKRTNHASSWLDVIGGKRATGLVFAGDVSGGLALSLRNFWQSYPSALEINGARTPTATLRLWIWSPYAEAMDLRHYDTTAHDLNVTYEDVQPGFSTPYGVSRSSEVMIFPYAEVPTNTQLADDVAETNNTSLLVATPQYLHKVGALGLWSLPDRSTKGKRWIEDQLDKAIAFYRQEIDRREWYGYWNYGDVMHSYDVFRHSWKYDIGGFAWDNTELSTDLWLWYSFLRTGRSDIFKMAEAMTRHTSEVDCYHLGPMAGLGSRHNVNHWGDGSKEVRESQAVLRRCFYYLTTDERTGDIMHETAMHADSGLAHVDPLRELLPKSNFPTHVRFGPDWVALVGDWMTEWERTGDIKWKNKILVGIGDFAKMPYGFYSGKGKDGGMGYDPSTNHIYQLDRDDIGSLHLANLMGGMEMAYELTPLLNNNDWNRLYLQYCSLYGAPVDEVQAAFGKEVKIRLGDPQPDFARQPAYAYVMTRDPKFAQRAWDYFLPNRPAPFGNTRFESRELKGPQVVKPLNEIRNVSTNGSSQWCLNAIELLQMAGDQLPEHNIAWDDSLTAVQSPGRLIYADDFSKPLDGKTWVVELEQKPAAHSSVYTQNNALVLDTRGGVTVWLNKVLGGNLQIEYDRKVLVDSGKNDRLSDLNQFWMASDPHNSDLFTRNGQFEAYDNLVLYYAGVGGNGNETTRFRKYYVGGGKPVIKEYLDAPHLLKANTNYHIKITVQNGKTSYWVNNECYFNYMDPAPLTSGYFGFRSTWSRQEIRNLKIFAVPL